MHARCKVPKEVESPFADPSSSLLHRNFHFDNIEKENVRRETLFL